MEKNMCRVMSPFEMAGRFSNKNCLDQLQSSSKISLVDYEPFISKLPEREQDLIEMYYHREKKQKEIAEFFGVTQGAVSHRLSRAIKRLKFLRDMPKLAQDLNSILSRYFSTFEIDLIRYMVETTCQSHTAQLLNVKYKLSGQKRMTQVKVRHKFDRCMQKVYKLKRSVKELKTCHSLMEYVRENLYMLHEVVLPHFNKGYRVKYVSYN